MGGHKGSTTTPMQWSDRNETTFIQLCYDFMKAGKLQCSTFKSDDWGKINDELRRITNHDYGIARLKGKWNRLRITHRCFSQIIGHTGITWNPHTNKVNAPEEVWEHFYTLNKTEYKTIRSNGCPHYETLGELFGGTTATGALGNASTQPPPTSDEEQEIEDAFLTKEVHVRAEKIDDDEIAKPGRRRKEPKISKSDKLEAFMQQCSSTMSARNDESELRQVYLREKLARLQGKSSAGTSDNEASSQDPFSQSVCMKILNNMEGLSNEMYVKAMKAFKDQNFRQKFVMVPEERRIPVLELL